MAFAAFTEIFVLALALMYTKAAAAPSKCLSLPVSAAVKNRLQLQSLSIQCSVAVGWPEII